jgi:hypothetical protein
MFKNTFELKARYFAYGEMLQLFCNRMLNKYKPLLNRTIEMSHAREILGTLFRLYPHLFTERLANKYKAILELLNAVCKGTYLTLDFRSQKYIWVVGMSNTARSMIEETWQRRRANTFPHKWLL